MSRVESLRSRSVPPQVAPQVTPQVTPQRKSRWRLPVGACAAALLVLPLTASATVASEPSSGLHATIATATATATATDEGRPPRVTTAATTDPDDTHGRLDLAQVRHRITVPRVGDTQVEYRLRTYRPFRTSILDARNRHFVLELGTDSVAGASHNIKIHTAGGRLRADLISNATRKRVARLAVSRPGARTVRVSGPRDLVGSRRYFAYSNFHRDRTGRCGTRDGFAVTCQDSVPERGWLRLDRPGWPRPTS